MITHVGDVGRINDMWLNKSGIANIVPLEVLAKIWRVTYDSSGGMNAGHFVIHTDQGNIPVHKKGHALHRPAERSGRGYGGGFRPDHTGEHGGLHPPGD